jgi:hypothetical protein
LRQSFGVLAADVAGVPACRVVIEHTANAAVSCP